MPKEVNSKTPFRTSTNAFTKLEEHYWDWMSNQANFLTECVNEDGVVEIDTIADIVEDFKSGAWLQEYYEIT